MPEIGGIFGDRLKSLITRIEALEAEKKALAVDIAEVFKEAASAGFEVKILRKVIALRKMDAADREAEAELIGLYLRAIGMQGELPL